MGSFSSSIVGSLRNVDENYDLTIGTIRRYTHTLNSHGDSCETTYNDTTYRIVVKFSDGRELILNDGCNPNGQPYEDTLFILDLEYEKEIQGKQAEYINRNKD